MRKLKIEERGKHLALAFGIPCGMMLVVMIIAGSEPFSNQRSMLYSDMYHQYYPFFVAFRNALRSGNGLLYTWSQGMGMDYLSLISYYLASPLNLLSVLIPESWTLEYFSLLVPVKLGLAGLFYAYFLNKMFDRTDISISLFGAFYGLCAWALGYQWNVMWLDTFALLPLMALGTVELLRDKKFVLYTVILFLSIFANYYIGLFVCIFVLLLFFCYEICRWQGFMRFFLDFVRIGCFTVIAIGMTAILELPALAGLGNTQSSVNSFPSTFRLNIASEHNLAGLFDAMRQVAGNAMGGVETTFKEGLPNLYCGVGSVLLAFLFLTGKEVKLRDKICSVFLLIFFMVSFIIRQLDYIWHGFHFTNMIPYRFSFLFSFVVLYMAYRAYLMRHGFRVWQLIVGGVLSLGMIFLSDSWRTLLEGSGSSDAFVFLAYNIGFLALYLVILGYQLPGKAPAEDAPESEIRAYRKELAYKRRFGASCMTAVMVLELAMNVLNFGLRFSYTTVTNYPKGTGDTEAVIEYMKEREEGNLFYRAETTHSQTLNDGALNGYYGVSTFTSSANVRVTEFMKALGYGAKNTYNRYLFEESSPVANLFLGLKYMIERDGNVEENSYFNVVYTSGNVSLLENNAYLPLGFLTEPELAELSFDGSDHFDLQNDLFRAATGIREPVWNRVENPAISGENVTIEDSLAGQCNYTGAQSGASITYEFTADRNGFLCLDFDVTDRNSYKVYLNGEELYSESLSLPQMIAVSDVTAGDVVRVRFTCKSGEEGRTNVKAGILDAGIFRAGVEMLQRSTLELMEFSSTYVAGTIDCHQGGLLYTSIPDDGNWQVYVDGIRVKHEAVGDAMIGVMLTQGEHQVEFRYHNTAFSYGWKISLACAIVFALCILVKPRIRQKGKFER